MNEFCFKRWSRQRAGKEQFRLASALRLCDRHLACFLLYGCGILSQRRPEFFYQEPPRIYSFKSEPEKKPWGIMLIQITLCMCGLARPSAKRVLRHARIPI